LTYALGSDSSLIDTLAPYSIGNIANRNASTLVDNLLASYYGVWVIFYAWTALSGRTTDVVVCLGITGDRERARLHAEEPLLDGRAFLVLIEMVRPVMAAHSLSPCYLRTGAAWLGRRNTTGGVAWRRFFDPVDGPDKIEP
jgi:hypothetical protein